MVEFDKYKFDIYFHGEDGFEFDKNTGNYDNLLKQNIIVDYIPRKLDISTTNIINKIILNYSNEKK